MKTWKYIYGSDTIQVANRSHVAELIVNGEVQDRRRGLTVTMPLTGKLQSGEEIKADLGGVFVMQCTLFVDNKLQEPIHK